jgi:hypothetical protein
MTRLSLRIGNHSSDQAATQCRDEIEGHPGSEIFLMKAISPHAPTFRTTDRSGITEKADRPAPRLILVPTPGLSYAAWMCLSMRQWPGCFYDSLCRRVLTQGHDYARKDV